MSLGNIKDDHVADAMSNAQRNRLVVPQRSSGHLSPGILGSHDHNESASFNTGVGSRRNTISGDEAPLRDKLRRDLDQTLSLQERVSHALVLCEEVRRCSEDTLDTLWEVADDLISTTATLDARKAGFALLTASAYDLEHSSRRARLFDMITTNVDVSLLSLQLSTLSCLSNEGQNVFCFERRILSYLNQLLQELFPLVERARVTKHDSSLSKSSGDSSVKNKGSSSESQSTSKPACKDLSNPKKDRPNEEKALLDVIYSIADVIAKSPSAFDEAQVKVMLANVTVIATKTTGKALLRGATKIITGAAEHLQIPTENLQSCVHALCAIIGSSRHRFGDEAWAGVYHLLRSSSRMLVNDALKTLLTSHPDVSETREMLKLRGALMTIRKIADDATISSLFDFDLNSLADCLTATYCINPQFALDTVKTISALVSNHSIAGHLSSSEWDVLDKLMQDVARSNPIPSDVDDPGDVRGSIDSRSPIYEYVLHKQGSIKQSEKGFIAVIEHIVESVTSLLEGPWTESAFARRKVILNILLQLGQYAHTAWRPVVDFMWKHGLLSPNDHNWRSHLGFLSVEVLTDPSKPESARVEVLEIFARLYPLMPDDSEYEYHCDRYLRFTCEKMKDEDTISPSLISSLAKLSACHGTKVNFETFETLVETVAGLSKITSTDATASVLMQEGVADCFVQLFLRCLARDCEKTQKLYSVLLSATVNSPSVGVKLSVMKLLSRLRCNADYAMRAVSIPDSQDLAAVLGRKKFSVLSLVSGQSTSSQVSINELQSARVGRSSAVGSMKADRSRSATRSVNAKERYFRTKPHLWMYGGPTQGLPEDPPLMASPHVFVSTPVIAQTKKWLLDMGPWLDLMIEEMRHSNDWDIYSYIIVHLPSQLSNCSLFGGYVRQLEEIHDLLNNQLSKDSFPDPPPDIGLRRGDIALCLYSSLTMLLAYQTCFGIRQYRRSIQTFRKGVETWDRTAKCCIHALAICCYEIPNCIEKDIGKIVEMMQKRITQADLAMDILEFLCGLARLREAYGSADVALCQKVFGICIRYIQHAREKRKSSARASSASTSTQYYRASGHSGDTKRTPESAQEMQAQNDVAEYVFTLAYQVIIFWFLAVDVRDRAQHVGWITQELAWKDELGRQEMEEQSLVILDMMHRTTFSDMGETVSAPEFLDPVRKKSTGTWLVGMSIITAEILVDGGSNKLGQFTKRQASGTTHAIYFHNTADLPDHHIMETATASSAGPNQPLNVYPSHMFLQLVSTIAPVPTPLQPIPLSENDEYVKRAIRIFDSIDTVDGHKAAVIYVDEGQTTETEILNNAQGTDAYEAFLRQLGTKVILKNAKFNTQGLDRHFDGDGTHTYAWRDRVTEIVFHVPTMMPSHTDMQSEEARQSMPEGLESAGAGVGGSDAKGLENQVRTSTGPEQKPSIIRKKSHIGNDHVKIIYNNSGTPFAFDTFSSAYNSIIIIITPEALTTGRRLMTDRTKLRWSQARPETVSDTERFGFYHVQTFCSPSYPHLSPAASPKIVSAEALPLFVRQLAINASVFCQVWEHRSQGEHISSWRARLQQITKLREKFANTNTSANVNYPMSNSEASGGNRAYLEGDTWTGDVAYGGLAQTKQLLTSLDFTRWTT